MSFWTKLVIVVLAGVAGFYIWTEFFDTKPGVEKKLVKEEIVEPEPQPEKTEEPAKKEEVKKTYATVYFLGVDKNSNGVFKKVTREVPEGKNKLTYAIQSLISGPNAAEKEQGVFSEVPKNVKLLGVVESESKIIIDISGNVQTGGGADSIYSRMKQIIKTALNNSPKKPIYLYIDGKQAEVLGGEGIMITQPLSENSLDE